MEDVKFDRSHSNSPLPEAGHDHQDPLRPEIDEENSTPTPPIGDPTKDMEAAEDNLETPDQDPDTQAEPDLDELSDNESVLSEVDEAQFEDFDPANIAIEDRPAVLDDSTLNLIGVHKRKRAEGEADGETKKKKKRDNRREKPRKSRKGRGDDEARSGDDGESRRRKRKEGGSGRARRAIPEEENEEHLTPEERMWLVYLRRLFS
jgi:transcription factor SPN1